MYRFAKISLPFLAIILLIGGNASTTTYTYSGDVTINWSDTLTLTAGDTIEFVDNTDSTSSGANNSKAELIISGYLRAIGTWSNPVVFKSVNDSTNGWYGIRVIDSGSADIQYAKILNSYIAYKNVSVDTLDADTLANITFDDFYAYGVYLSNRNMVVDQLMIDNASNWGNGHGIYLDSVDFEITDCSVYRTNEALCVDDGAPVFRDCDFHGFGGTYGVRINKYGNSDTVRFVNCVFEDFDLFSFAIGQDYSYAVIDSCIFYAPRIYGLLNIYDSSFVKMRNTMYEWSFIASPYGIYLVYTKGGNTDLGSIIPNKDGNPDPDIDEGNNYFTPSGLLIVGYMIYNSSSTDTTFAYGNCLDEDIWEDTSFVQSLIYKYDTTVIFTPGSCTDWFSAKAVFNEENLLASNRLSISQNYPNPFNPTTNIMYTLPENSDVEIIVYNILGQNIKTVLDEYQEAGEHKVEWSGLDDNGNQVASGIYFYRINAGKYSESKKMILLK